MTEAHTSRAHAKLSPSGASRWMNCPGSIRMSEGIEDKSGFFADQGTAAHTLGEHCLVKRKEPADFLGGHVNINAGRVSTAAGSGDGVFEIDADMIDAVSLYVDTVHQMTEPTDEIEYEAKLDLRHVPGMEFGTGDLLAYRESERLLIVIDYKHGAGVPVEVHENPQLLAYAIGAAKRFHNRGIDKVKLVVVQPRCPHPEGPVRSDELDVIDLVGFFAKISAAAEATADPEAPLNPGKWCRFCPASGICPAQREKVLAVAHMEFGGEPPAVSDMTPDDMADVLRDVGVIKDWLKRVEERAHQMARDGEPPTGFKLVASRATRHWLDEDDAKQRMNDMGLGEIDIYVEPKMKSPAQMEKTLGRKRASEIQDLIGKSSSGSILVPEEDARPPLRVRAEDEFAA